MVRSMTGFGKCDLKTKFGLFTVEIKTLNHKFLEITPKLPNSLGVFDERVKSLTKDRIKRGKVYLNLTHDTAEELGGSITVDEKLAKKYHDKLKRLKNRLNIKEPIKLVDIVSFPGVINQKLVSNNITKAWPSVRAVVLSALENLVKDREREGASLYRDLITRIRKIKTIVSRIKTSASSNVNEYKKKLKERVKELTGGYPVDRGRLEMEVALFAKNSDISEELTRLKDHISNFIKTLKKGEEVGKKLDFIAQELHREINTVGAKTSGFNISKGVIEVKTEIEKIREQLKNIE